MGRPPLLQQLGHQAGPAGLVAGAEAAAGVAVEVLVEQEVIAEVGVVLEQLDVAEDRPAPVGVAQEEPRQPPRQLVGTSSIVTFRPEPVGTRPGSRRRSSGGTSGAPR